MRLTPVLAAAAGLTLLAAACGDDSPAADPTTAPPATEVMVDETMVDDMTDETMADDMTDETMADDMTDDSMADDMMLAPWQELVLTDVDGTTFTLADFMGKPVLVEHFATWCPNCREQLVATNAAAAELGEDAVVLALSVETDLDAADVAEYAADNGFTNVRFAVMTPEFLAAVSDYFGNDSINPPSTPHYVIDSHGAVGALMTGSSSSTSLVDALHTAGM